MNSDDYLHAYNFLWYIGESLISLRIAAVDLILIIGYGIPITSFILEFLRYSPFGSLQHAPFS